MSENVSLSVPAAIIVGALIIAGSILFMSRGASLPLASTLPAAVSGTPMPATPAPIVNVEMGHFPILGKADAPVKVVVFADFRCPYCEQLYRTVEMQIQKEYVDTGKVQFAFRHYAFLGPASTLAANAAECANEQGKFWEMHHYFYEHQPSESDTSMYTVDNLTTIAKGLGMNAAQFTSCLSTNKYNQKVTDDLTAGQAAGVQGTPATFINGQLVSGAQQYSAFKTIIDQELQKVGK